MSDNSLTDTNLNATVATSEVSKNNPSQEGVENQPTKVYSQAELDAIAAEVRRKTEAKLAKRFEGIDVEHYKSLQAKEESERIAKAKEKSEFEKLLKDNAEKFNSKITTLTSELTKIKVDGALISAASAKRAVNPDQVARLVRDNVRMLDTGEVEVVDPKTGQTRYTENGDPLTVDGLVSEFLNTNPHFVSAGQPGGGTRSNTNTDGAKQVDVNALDMSNPEHRKIYAELRKKRGY